MYIFKNALKCITRSMGRNILTGIIVVVISLSACIGLSIRQAAENARESILNGMSVTATISFDRQAAMGNMRDDKAIAEPGEKFNKEDFSEMMNNNSELTLEEYLKYTEASTVDDYYYVLTASVNGTDDFEPVSNEISNDNFNDNGMGMPDMGGMGNKINGIQSDFSVLGVSSEKALQDFADGKASVLEGTVFDATSNSFNCIISQELATYNSISVGDSIVFTNPNNEADEYTFTVSGIYSDSTSNSESFSIMGSTSTDPANKIYTSYAALDLMVGLSAENAEQLTDEDTGREYSTELGTNLSMTYVFRNTDDYDIFVTEVYEMGLDEAYTVYSEDVSQFENSLLPLETLSETAGYFLIIVLAIGAVVLVVLNILNIRERKYEIGVLTAMGMKKCKVALQLLSEIFAVTLVAVMLGTVIGGATSVPVTNALLEKQIVSQSESEEAFNTNLGRDKSTEQTAQTPPDMGGNGQMPENGGGFLGKIGKSAANYITEIDSAVNLTVVFQMIGIALLLTVTAGLVSVLYVMRYDPLQILANRN